MRIQSLLGKLSEEQLERFAQSPIWKPAVQRGCTWEDAAVNDSIIQETAHLLPPYAVTVLKELLRSFAAVPVEKERLLHELRMNTDLAGAECLLGLTELEEAGVLFSVRKVWGERMYFLPLESFICWQRALFPFEAVPLSIDERSRLMEGTTRRYNRPLGRQLLAAFAALGRLGMTLTASGTLPKKTISRLLEAVDLDETVLASFHLKWSFPDHYPIKVAFILEAGFSAGLLEQDEGKWSWNNKRLAEWLRVEEGVRERQLMQWVLSLFLPASGLHAHLAAVLSGLQAGSWYSEQEIIASFKENKVSLGIASELQLDSSLLRWSELWHNLGWLEIVDSEEKGKEKRDCFVRWKSAAPLHNSERERLSRKNPPFVSVSPSGELMVELDSPFWVRWELALLAELKSDEQVAVYRMEAGSIAQALEHGRTPADIKHFLLFISGGEPLPSAAESLLEVWTSRACRTEFAEVTLLRCDNEDMAVRVESNPALSPYLLQKLGASDFVVEKSQIGEIRQLLKKAGYTPRKAMQSDSTRKEESSYPRMAQVEMKNELSESFFAEERTTSAPAYIYDPFALHHFELSEPFDREKMPMQAQRERIPSMWIKQLRVYHHSTRRELIEQALQWQTPVQLRMQRELRSFVPEKLEQQGDGWAVIGLLRDEPERSLMRLTPDMWEEMRLVIPGQEAPI